MITEKDIARINELYHKQKGEGLTEAEKSEQAKHNAELLGLMVNEPHIEPSELSRLTMPVLVIAGTKDMIKAHLFHIQCLNMEVLL